MDLPTYETLGDRDEPQEEHRNWVIDASRRWDRVPTLSVHSDMRDNIVRKAPLTSDIYQKQQQQVAYLDNGPGWNAEMVLSFRRKSMLRANACRDDDRQFINI